MMSLCRDVDYLDYRDASWSGRCCGDLFEPVVS